MVVMVERLVSVGCGLVFLLYIAYDENSLLWSVTWCFPCVHTQSESLCLKLLTVSSGRKLAAS